MRREHSWRFVPACAAAVLVLAGFGVSPSSEQDPAVRLERAIQLETVDGDLRGAITLYEHIVAAHGSNAAVAAKALYRLGGCQEKLGSREAGTAYRRLIDEYPGQTDEVALARARLAALGVAAAEASGKPTFRKIRIPANPGNGVLSPGGRRFAFAAQGSVWVVPIPGNVQPDLAGEPVRLTEPMGAWNTGNTMVWSGDGRWIAFNTYDDKGEDLYVVSSEGGVPKRVPVTRVIPGTVPFAAHRVSLSRDGGRVAFSSTDSRAAEFPAGPGERRAFPLLYVVPRDGGEASRLADVYACDQAFSHDGTRIAHVRPMALDGDYRKMDLWIMNADGSRPVRLTDSPGRVQGPVWSPDDRMIAVNHEPPGFSGSREIWIQPAPRDGKNPGPATKIELPLESLSVSFSALAGWTAADTIGLLLRNRFHQAVYTVPASGGKATQVTPEGEEAWPSSPKWSPDGKRLFLRWGRGNVVSVPASGGQLTVVHDAEKTHVIAGLPGVGNGISPDGKTVVFMAGRKESLGRTGIRTDIWTVPATGGEPRQITQSPTQDRFPCWSPDGKSVAFIRYTPNPEGGYVHDILVTSSEGGEARQITSGSDKVGWASIDWSPDGTMIAYFSKDKTINLIPARGGERKVLADVGSFGPHSDLSWSPDGNELAYTSASAGRLMVVSLKSGETREVPTGVLDEGVQNFHVDWSPDGSKLAFSAGFGGDDELWLMEDFLHLVGSR